jgi:hypothetical protein
VSLHGKKGLGKKDRKGWHCDKILVHLKEFGPSMTWSKKGILSYNPTCGIMSMKKHVVNEHGVTLYRYKE